MLQFLIEEALLEHLELDDAIRKASEAEERQTQDAVADSIKRREQAELALQKAAG